VQQVRTGTVTCFTARTVASGEEESSTNRSRGFKRKLRGDRQSFQSYYAHHKWRSGAVTHGWLALSSFPSSLDTSTLAVLVSAVPLLRPQPTGLPSPAPLDTQPFLPTAPGLLGPQPRSRLPSRFPPKSTLLSPPTPGSPPRNPRQSPRRGGHTVRPCTHPRPLTHRPGVPLQTTNGFPPSP
jgi:hypothetical protein